MIALALIAAAPALPPASIADCRAGQLRLTSEGREGAFSGMSHGGTLLVLRNAGRRACRVPGLPRVTMYDRRGRALPVARHAPVGMHPGPVIRPVTIPAHGSVNAPLRWVAGPVFDHNRCVTATRVGVAIGGKTLHAAGAGQLCGEAGTPIGFEQPVLTTKPFE